MRSHFLSDLNLNGAELVLRLVQDFDFYRLTEVIGLSWLQQESERVLFITALYEVNEESRIPVTFLCRGVRNVRFPRVNPSFYLAELEVEDVSSWQLEGVRFKMKDYAGDLEIDCAELEIVGAGVTGTHLC